MSVPALQSVGIGPTHRERGWTGGVYVCTYVCMYVCRLRSQLQHPALEHSFVHLGVDIMTRIIIVLPGRSQLVVEVSS